MPKLGVEVLREADGIEKDIRTYRRIRRGFRVGQAVLLIAAVLGSIIVGFGAYFVGIIVGVLVLIAVVEIMRVRMDRRSNSGSVAA